MLLDILNKEKKIVSDSTERPRRESNPGLKLRKLTFYPLYYGGEAQSSSLGAPSVALAHFEFAKAISRELGVTSAEYGPALSGIAHYVRTYIYF